MIVEEYSQEVIVLKCHNYSGEEIRQALNRIQNEFAMKEQSDVIVKPNLCLPIDYAEHLTTHPEIINQVINVAQDNGIRNISLADTPVGKADSKRRNELWIKTGMQRLIELKGVKRNDLDNNLAMRQIHIGDKRVIFPMSDDIFNNTLINVPKFKTHGFMFFSGAVKNLYGVLPEYTKKRLHRELEEKDEFAKFLVEFANMISPALNIMDAIIGIEGEGPGVKGRKRYIGVILISKNVFALDYVAAQLMGIEALAVPTIQLSLEEGYLDESRVKILGESIDQFIIKDYQLPVINEATNKLTQKLFHLSRYEPSIDLEKCVRCGICLQNCPHSAIRDDDHIMQIDRAKCKSCLVCHEICPHGAVNFKSYSFLKELSRKEESAKLMREKRWVFVLGNPDSTNIALRIKKRGYLVALVHNKPLKINSDTFDLHIADITEKELREYNIKGVINYHSESNVIKYSEICERLNFVGIPIKAAKIMTNKLKLKEFLYKWGIKYPSYICCRDLNNVVLESEKYYVIKPIDNSNSRGVYLVEGGELTDEVIEQSRAHSKRGEVIIEEFISGEEYDITCIVWDNEVIDIYINRRLRYEDGERFGEAIGFQTVTLEKNLYGELRNICVRTIKNLDIKKGVISYQMIFNEGWYVIEMAGRAMGGGLVEFLYAVNNVNIDEILVNISLGESIEELLGKKRERYGAFLFADKFINNLHGDYNLQEARKSKGVLWFNIKTGNCEKVSGGVLCYGEDDDDALCNALTAMDKLKSGGEQIGNSE